MHCSFLNLPIQTNHPKIFLNFWIIHLTAFSLLVLLFLPASPHKPSRSCIQSMLIPALSSIIVPSQGNGWGLTLGVSCFKFSWLLCSPRAPLHLLLLLPLQDSLLAIDKNNSLRKELNLKELDKQEIFASFKARHCRKKNKTLFCQFGNCGIFGCWYTVFLSNVKIYDILFYNLKKRSTCWLFAVVSEL